MYRLIDWVNLTNFITKCRNPVNKIFNSTKICGNSVKTFKKDKYIYKTFIRLLSTFSYHCHIFLYEYIYFEVYIPYDLNTSRKIKIINYFYILKLPSY